MEKLSQYIKRELIHYIKQEMEKGQPIEKIKKILLDSGHHRDMIEEVIEDLKKHNFDVEKAASEKLRAEHLKEHLYHDVKVMISDYIKAQLRLGHKMDDIKAHIARSGHSEKLIEDAIDHMLKTHKIEPRAVKKDTRMAYHIEKQLHRYIRSALEKGYSLDHIKRELIEHNKNIIDRSISSLKKASFNTDKALQENTRNSQNESPLYIAAKHEVIKYIAAELNAGYKLEKIESFLHDHFKELIHGGVAATMHDYQRSKKKNYAFYAGFCFGSFFILAALLSAMVDVSFPIILLTFLPTLLSLIYLVATIDHVKNLMALWFFPVAVTVLFYIGGKTSFLLFLKSAQMEMLAGINLFVSLVYYAILIYHEKPRTYKMSEKG